MASVGTQDYRKQWKKQAHSVRGKIICQTVVNNVTSLPAKVYDLRGLDILMIEQAGGNRSRAGVRVRPKRNIREDKIAPRRESKGRGKQKHSGSKVSWVEGQGEPITEKEIKRAIAQMKQEARARKRQRRKRRACLLS